MIPIEYLRECFELDAENGRLFWKERPREHFSTERRWKIWNTRYSGTEALTTRHSHGYFTGSLTVEGTTHHVYRHRVIYAMYHDVWPDYVDHINNDVTDNCIHNLRSATKAQNQQNQKRKATNTSGVKGVYVDRGYYRARIYVENKPINLGYFHDLSAAAAAYAAAAHKYHGEFARID
jgi:hypothetical protein